MIFNESARKMFGYPNIDEIPAVSEYPIWKKTDPFGRAYYGVSNFWCVDGGIDEDCDLSWLEWDGNKTYITGTDSKEIMLLFRKTIGVMKSWQAQFAEKFPGERFAILASFDDGSAMDEDSRPHFEFVMRFWKIREGQGFDGNDGDINMGEPIIMWISE